MGSKAPNPGPPKYDDMTALSIPVARLAGIFNEWAKRYVESPGEFTDMLDSNGQPFADYGESCAIYVCKLNAEIK